MMINFRDESLTAISEAGKTPNTIIYIGDRQNSCTWTEFLRMANRQYDNGYGSEIVNPNLVIVFQDDSWLERAEYDGSEWWSYKKCPPSEEKNVTGNLELFPINNYMDKN